MMENFTSSRMSNVLFLLKSRLFVAVSFCLFVFKMNGQVANYSFSESSGTYTNITGTTAIASGWDDNVTANTIPIGFSFNFNGTNYTTCSVNANGFITFGSTTSASDLYVPISNSTGYAGAISALGIDLIDDNLRDIVYTTTGVSPNRVFTVQWRQVRRFARSGRFNFQIKLNESSNIINVIYGNCVPDGTTGQALNVQVGLRGATDADFNNRSLTADALLWDDNTTAGANNTATCRTRSTNYPSVGRTFTWAPPVVIASSATLPICSGSPTTLTASSIADYTYSWSPATGLNSTTGSSVIATPTTTTTYTVTGTRGTVTTTKTIVVNVNPSPSNISLTQTVSPIGASSCDIDYVKLDATGGVISNAVLYTEDFSAGVATNWAYGGTDTRVKGYYFNSNNAGGTLPEAGLAADGGVWANTTGTYVFQPYNFSTNTAIPVNTLNYTTLNLSFKYRLVVFLPGVYNSSIYVDVSTNNVNWTNVWSNVDVGSNVTANVTVNLNSYINNNQLYFRFRYTGDSFGLNTWYFDDVNIIGDKREISWSPSAGLFTDAALTNAYVAGTYANTVYAAPDSSTNFVASGILGTCSKTATTSSIIRAKKVFTGLDATNPTFWNQTENWATKTLPTSDKCVVIPAGKTVVVNIPTAAAKSVTVNDGGQLTIASNQALTIQEAFVNQGTGANVVVEDDGMLHQINDVDNIGNITVKRTTPLTANRLQYNFMISPVIGQKMKYVYGVDGSNVPYIPYAMRLNEPTNTFVNDGDGNYVEGKGFAIKEPNAGYVVPTPTATFNGVPANGDMTYDLGYTTTPSIRGYNLSGNPYPSNLDLVKLYYDSKNTADNSFYVNSTFRFWDSKSNAIFTQQGGNYQGYAYALFNAASGPTGMGTTAQGGAGVASSGKKPNQFTKVGQGFMVRATQTGAKLIFKNSQRSTSTAESGFFGKNTTPIDRYWLELETPTNMVVTNGIVYFEQGINDFATDDTRIPNSQASDALFSYAGEAKVVINGKSSFTDADVLPLGTRHYVSGTYKIRIKDAEGVFANGQTIYLKDKQLGIVANLSAGDYTFTSEPGEFTNRFEIVYKEGLVLATDNTNKGKIEVFRDSTDFVVRSWDKSIKTVELYDAAGRLVFTMNGNSKELRFGSDRLVNGMYILKAELKDGEQFTKKIRK